MSATDTAFRIAVLCAIASAGALAGIAIGLPVPLLTGPALLATAASLLGVPVAFPIRFRNLLFLFAGITIGSGVSRDSLAALATWPLAFALLGVALTLMLLLGQAALRPILGSGRAAALLATTPGHLSFVIALSEDAGLDSRRISIVQSVRLLALTMFVPFAARALGLETGIGIASQGGVMGLWVTLGAIGAAVLLSPVLTRLRFPAPLLIAGMIAGAVARVSGLSDGGLAPVLSRPTLALCFDLAKSRKFDQSQCFDFSNRDFCGKAKNAFDGIDDRRAVINLILP